MKRFLFMVLLTLLVQLCIFSQEDWKCDAFCQAFTDFHPVYACNVPQATDYHQVEAFSTWVDDGPAPTDWVFRLDMAPYVYGPQELCEIDGCHLHPRDFNPSHQQEMLASLGGIRCSSTEDFDVRLTSSDTYYQEIIVRHPEAAGKIALIVEAKIPAGAIRDDILLLNPGWHFVPSDPNWIYTVLYEEYYIRDLVNLPDTDFYLKNAPQHGLHTEGGAQYGTGKVIWELYQLAQEIRDKYYEYTVYYVKISFNDLSLRYGGMFDLDGDWKCDRGSGGHTWHRIGKSVDLNTTLCLTCDQSQEKEGCQNRRSSDTIKVKDRDGNEEEMTVKAWIDRLAGRRHFEDLHRDWRIHLEYQGEGGGND